jgi:hypothetical protein
MLYSLFKISQNLFFKSVNSFKLSVFLSVFAFFFSAQLCSVAHGSICLKWGDDGKHFVEGEVWRVFAVIKLKSSVEKEYVLGERKYIRDMYYQHTNEHVIPLGFKDKLRLLMQKTSPLTEISWYFKVTSSLRPYVSQGNVCYTPLSFFCDFVKENNFISLPRGALPLTLPSVEEVIIPEPYYGGAGAFAGGGGSGAAAVADPELLPVAADQSVDSGGSFASFEAAGLPSLDCTSDDFFNLFDESA